MLIGILFLLAVIIVLLSSHGLVYLTIIKFIEISQDVKTFLFYVFVFLFLSFVISVIFLRINENIISRGFYFLAGFWQGWLVYLFLASILIWLVYLLNYILLSEIFRPGIYSGLTVFLFIISLIISLHGVYNAFNPVVKNIDVKINNLPASWQNKKIVQLSDVHLGAIHNPKFLEKIVKQINDENPDLVVITGDLFDGMDGDLEVFVTGLKKLKASHGVYLALGNHEEYLGLTEPLKIIEKTDIKILDNEATDIDGLQLVGVSYHNNSEIKNLDKNKPSILLHHTPTDLAINQNHDASEKQWKAYLGPDVIFDQAQKLGIDFQLSGHTHEGQFFPFDIVTRLIFKGYHYGLHKQGDFQIYVSSGTGTWGPPMRVNSKSEIVVINLK